ncbi:hypothetical protein HAX54_045528 [Datura stramonium]|uniref:Uncharacterized protein n=1 Tax=Datura stramonium TaxID=4076 RepID=A0ABS8SQU1_DATST|nr:hypothetical protein [Datura stramonium]
MQVQLVSCYIQVSSRQKNIMDWAFVHKIWEKFISSNVGSGQPLKAALLINYDPSGPSRLMSTMFVALLFNCKTAPSFIFQISGDITGLFQYLTWTRFDVVECLLTLGKFCCP